MPDIEFNCPHCKQSLTIEEAGAGMTVQCPGCNEKLIVPPSLNCPSCGKKLPQGVTHCITCGGQAQKQAQPPVAQETTCAVCPSCGKQLPQGVRYCIACGSSTGASVDAPSQPDASTIGISLICPGGMCKKRFVVPNEKAGQLVQCPACKKEIEVIGTGRFAEKADFRLRKPQQESLSKSSSGNCPSCGKSVQQDAVICVNCGTNLKTGAKVQGAVETNAIISTNNHIQPHSDPSSLVAVCFQWSPCWLLIDAKIPVYLDGKQIGEGTIKKGGCFRFKTHPGKHELSIKVVIRGMVRYPVNLEKSGFYEITTEYDSMMGTFVPENVDVKFQDEIPASMKGEDVQYIDSRPLGASPKGEAFIGRNVVMEHLSKAVFDILDKSEILVGAFDGTLVTNTGEKISGFTWHDYLLVTDSRAVIWGRGMLSNSVTSLHFKDISSITEGRSVILGGISIMCYGQAYNFTNMQLNEISKAAQMIRESMDRCRASLNPSTIGTGTSVADEIRKIAGLRDDGILTVEEFNTKKAELLKRM